MKEFNYVITDPVGIHARPAGILAKEAKNFKSVISIEKDGKTADVRRLIAVMGLGIKQGDSVRVTIEGEDEDSCFDIINQFFKENF